ncbi:hypothetical protein R1flu_021181 [Riccia fluitans]|uniref:Uncharacterized protein n=1 Tax=Riccia fluitans TaxID=41844 RepID=A0ABD1ZNN7_9MARC
MLEKHNLTLLREKSFSNSSGFRCVYYVVGERSQGGGRGFNGCAVTVVGDTGGASRRFSRSSVYTSSFLSITRTQTGGADEPR